MFSWIWGSTDEDERGEEEEYDEDEGDDELTHLPSHRDPNSYTSPTKSSLSPHPPSRYSSTTPHKSTSSPNPIHSRSINPSPDRDEDYSQYDLSMIPPLKNSLKAKDEQLVQLEALHHEEITQLKQRQIKIIQSLKHELKVVKSQIQPSDGNGNDQSGDIQPNGIDNPDFQSDVSDPKYVDIAIIHSHPEYMSLHHQYSQLFEAYNNLQSAYSDLDSTQQTLQSSMREELEFELRQNLQLQFEEIKQKMDEEREKENEQFNLQLGERDKEIDQLRFLLVDAQTIRERNEKQTIHSNNNVNETQINELNQHVEALTQQILSLQQEKKTEADSYTSNINSLLEESNNLKQQIQGLHSTIESQQSDIDHLNTQAAEAAAANSLSSSQSEDVSQKSELNHLRDVMSQQEKYLQDQHLQFSQMNAHIEEQQKTMQAQYEHIQVLEQQLNSMNNTNDIHLLNSEIERLKSEIASKDQQLTNLHSTVSGKLEQVKAVLTKKDKQIRNLQEQLSALQGRAD